jgi:hypothetical protein
MSLKKEDLKIGFDKMLGANTQIIRKQKSLENQKKEAFISIINKYDQALTRSVILHSDFKIDLSDYEDPYYNIIDELILLSWGPDIYSLIEFFFYKRIGEDGIENFIEDENGNEIYIRNPEDLYLLINKLYPGII